MVRLSPTMLTWLRHIDAKRVYRYQVPERTFAALRRRGLVSRRGRITWWGKLVVKAAQLSSENRW
jgi:hypothetical protein